MKLIAGLGNPGEKYQSTRHNVGYLFVDFFQEHISFQDWHLDSKSKSFVSENGLGEGKVTLLKPDRYMNESGLSVSAYANWYKVIERNILVVHDDLDIPFGKWKFGIEKGPKAHNGILSVETLLKAKAFFRLRIGIDNRKIAITGEDYVLGSFTEDEKETLYREIFPSIVLTVKDWITS